MGPIPEQAASGGDIHLEIAREHITPRQFNTLVRTLDPVEADQGPLRVSRDESWLSIVYPGRRLAYRLSTRGTSVLVLDAGAHSAKEISAYLLGPILGLVLRLRGKVALHASAIATQRGGIALIGPSGMGKSTMLSELLSMDYAMLTDDVLALDFSRSEVHAAAGYPGVRLWRDSVAVRSLDPANLSILVPGFEKQLWDIKAAFHRFPGVRTKLIGIFILDRSSSVDAPRFETLSPGASLRELVENLYPNSQYPITRGQLDGALQFLARIVETVVIRRLTFPDNLNKLGDTARRLIEFTRNLEPRPDDHAASSAQVSS